MMAKKIKLSFLWMLLAYAPMIGFAQNSHEMDLEECLKYALENATEMRNAYLDVQISSARVGEVKSDGLPQINGAAEFTYNYKIQQVILPADFAGFGDPSAPPPDGPVALPFGVTLASNAAINARQLIFDGVFFLGLRAANVYKDLARKSLQQTSIDVKVNVTKAYYAVLINEERQELLDKNLSRLQVLLNETKAMYENGFAEKIDVDRIRVSYNNVKIEKQRIERGLEVSKILLKFQMGMPLDDYLTITETFDRYALETYLPEPPEANPEARIEYSLLSTQSELDELNVRQFSSGYYPKLYLNNTLGWNTGGNRFSDLSRWFGFGFVGLSLEVPIFDGRRKKFQIDQARFGLQQTKNNQKQLERSIGLEVRQNYLSLLSSLEALEAQRENRELAEEVFRVTTIKFQEGIGSNLEVVEAETAFKEAETNYFNALYDVLVFQVDYDRALGKIQPN